MIVALAIALLSALMVGTFAVSHSRAERARCRAQLIADFAAALARTPPVDISAVATNVVSLGAYRVRRLTSAHPAHGLQQSRHATR